ncbi:MAG: Tetraacyldisaccharide 4'-kinase, partial [uncultured Cytophagales bacterium]
ATPPPRTPVSLRLALRPGDGRAEQTLRPEPQKDAPLPGARAGRGQPFRGRYRQNAPRRVPRPPAGGAVPGRHAEPGLRPAD